MDNNKIQSFENKKVRSVWDAEKEEWFFSVVDVVAVLTDSPNPRNYWKVLKHRLVAEGSELVTNCNQLKMLSNPPPEALFWLNLQIFTFSFFFPEKFIIFTKI